MAEVDDLSGVTGLPASFCPVPVMSWRRFAEYVGLDADVVRGMCERGHLPTLRVGRYRFINLLALSERCSSSTLD